MNNWRGWRVEFNPRNWKQWERNVAAILLIICAVAGIARLHGWEGFGW